MTIFTTITARSLTYTQSSLLSTPHGMFNRHGGTSYPPYASLNLSYGVGDSQDQVAANRQLIKRGLGIPVLLSAKQVHGSRVYSSSDLIRDKEVEGYDALLTDQKGVGLLIQQADCQAVLLHDPVREAIAAIHCGWRGSALNLIGKTIETMRHNYSTDPAHLRAVISPSLGPCCAEFINYRNELPERLHLFQAKPFHFDFWEISASQLSEAGILRNNIGIAKICTACNREYYSYRRTRKKGANATGRHGSVICLPAV